VPDTYTLREAAERAAVSPSTLKRWGDAGMIPELRRGGVWTPAAVSHARIVARLRERGHGLEQIRRAGRPGRLAYAYIEALLKGFDEPRQLCRATRKAP
jgi:adenylate cyclase